MCDMYSSRTKVVVCVHVGLLNLYIWMYVSSSAGCGTDIYVMHMTFTSGVKYADSDHSPHMTIVLATGEKKDYYCFGTIAMDMTCLSTRKTCGSLLFPHSILKRLLSTMET